MWGFSENRDVGEVKSPQIENYKEIRPENGMTVDAARSFWDEKFSEFGGQYNPYEKRLSCVPVEGERGSWDGERGGSKFIPSDETEAGAACKERLGEYSKDGVEYKNLEPDFSECSEGTVYIDAMTEHRDDFFDENGELQDGNFTQADRKLAESWNEQKREGRNDWTEEDVYDFRHDNRLSWHERCDLVTMDLVPYDIHSYCKHLGGVSECKVRNSMYDGGEFDE